METQCVRDFIYIDINRVRSIISQLEEGLINETQITDGNCETTAVGGSGGIPHVLTAKAGAEFQTHQQSLETKSPHDYIYNKVENLLLNETKLLRIPNEENCNFSLKLRESIGNTSFILTKGKVNINDFNKLSNFLTKYTALTTCIIRSKVKTQMGTSPQSAKNMSIANEIKKYEKALDKDTRNDIITFIDMFYRDRVIIKIIPFSEYPDFRFVGNIDQTYLRDNLESIIYKYGTAPVSDWTMLCQIASIPPEKRSTGAFKTTGSPIENAFQSVFDSYRVLENVAQSANYPEIAVTPIAIYRE